MYLQNHVHVDTSHRRSFVGLVSPNLVCRMFLPSLSLILFQIRHIANAGLIHVRQCAIWQKKESS